jgi:serpin B
VPRLRWLKWVAIVKKQYGADIGRVDFIGAPDAAVKEINDWVSRATREKIPTVIGRQHVDDMTRLVLVNAVYFLGKWNWPFEKEDTTSLDFFRAPDKPVRVPTMYQQGMFRFFHADGVKVLHLPYRGAKAPSLILVLPDAIDGLAVVESKLTSERFRVWEQSAGSQDEKVWLPSFKFASDLQLSGILAKLGMSSAFDASRANFSGISGNFNRDQPLFIQHVIQRAIVAVDEEGTEAAAATSTTTTSAEPGGPPPRPLEFRADHPFLFFIQDKETGAILFMGRVADPSKG